MRKFLWLLLLMVGLGGSAFAQGYEKIQLYCEKGGEVVTTDGRASTTKVQRSYPSCTVTVYTGGTLTLASIASDSGGTPKSNPFTADSDGYISFYAQDGTYDVKMSGSGLATPITRTGFWVITSSGGGGSDITGSGTTNRFPIFTSSSSIGNSVFAQVGTSEFAPAATGKRINLGTGSQLVVEVANASTTGTTQNRLAKLTGAPATAIIATTTDTTKVVGIVAAGAGTTGNAQIVTSGNVTCTFDGSTTAGNYVGASTTTNGMCKDLGSSMPSTGVQVIGRVLETIASAGNATVYVFAGEQGKGNVNGSGTTAYLAYWTGSSALGSTGVLYDTLNNIYQFGGNVDISNAGVSELTFETDQIIFKGGAVRSNSAIMQTMKATASQTGDFQRFTTSAGSARFRVDIDGDVLPRGVNYTWPATLPVSTGCFQVTSAGVISVVSCGGTTDVRYALNIKEAPYSCVGDGVADDTTCFQTAVDDGELAGGYIVYAPAGTYKVTGLTVPGGVTLQGDGRAKSIIYSNTNAVIVDAVVGSGSYAFKGPEIYDLQILGSGNVAHTSQIGLQIEDATYFLGVVVQDIEISQTGSHGVYFGKVFSSYFDNITSGSTMTGYPFLFNQINMPGNTFRNLYAADVNSTSPAGFRIRSGNITCWGCNGINNSSSNSWWAIIGDKVGVDGAVANRAAYLNCIDCNIESSRAGGILHYYNSRTDLSGTTLFSGDAGSAGTYIALKYEVDSAIFPPFFVKGVLSPSTTFANSPLSYYANSEVIHANDLPPVSIEGAVRQADGNLINTYYNTTNARSEAVYRVDGARPVTTITATASFTNPGATNYEANCAAPCTLTLPWPSWYKTNTDYIYVRNIGAGTLTINANSGGTVNSGGSYTLVTGESVVFMPHTASADYRLVGLQGAGAANRIPYFDGVQHLTSSANLTYDGTTVLNQKAGGNPYFAANDTTNNITTRFGPLAGAPDRAIVGTVSNHPFGFWTNGTEKWTVGTAGHFTPGAASTYDIGSTSLPINDIYVNGEVQWSTSGTVFDTYGTGSPEGVVTAAVGSVYRRTNGSSGTTLYIKESGSGNTGWVAVASGSSSLTSTYVGYGNGSNALTGTSDFFYNTTTKTLSIVNASGSSNLVLSGSSDTSAVKFGATSVPGNQGGILFPFVGGSNSSGPGIWWGSSASYGSLSGIYLSNGFTFQGANSTHAQVKIRKSTSSSSDGETTFLFSPNSGYAEYAPFGTSAGNTTEQRFLELAANGSNYFSIKAADNIASTRTLVLPNDDPTAGEVLSVTSFSGGIITTEWAAGGSGSGITNLNGLTATTQSFAVGTSGSDFNISSATSTHTFNIPDAGASARGLVTTGTQTLAGAKSFTSVVTANPGTTPATAVLIDINSLGSAGTRDSNWLVFRGRSNDGSARLTEWKQYVDVTANAGTSQLVFESRIDAASFTSRFTIGDDSAVSGGAFSGDSFTASGGSILDDDVNAATGFTVAGTAASGQYLRGNGTRAVFAALDGGDLSANTVTNAKLAQVATATFKGRTTSGTGDVEDLTATQATALLDVFTTSAKGLVPVASGGSTTTQFLRKDGTWAVPAGGGSSPPFADNTALVMNNTDNTKLIRFSLSGITTGTTRVITPPDTDGTLVYEANTASLSGKTLLSAVLSGSTISDDIIFSPGSALASEISSGNTFNLSAYDVDGVTYVDFLRLTSANSPSLEVLQSLTWADGVKQTFNPNGTNAGLNVGSQAGAPSSLANGDVWYDSTANKFKCRENGSTVDCISGGGGGLGDPGANGIVVRTALNTTTARSIAAGSSGGLTATNGDGVSGNPTIDFTTTNTSGLGINFPGSGGIPFTGDSSSSLAGSANEVRVVLVYIDRRITVDRVAVNGVVDSASNNAGFGIYTSNGNTKVCDSGAVSTTSWSGANNYALSASCTFGPGYFYYAWTASSTTPTARSGQGISNYFTPLNNGSGTMLGTAANASSGGVLPTTLGALTDSGGLAIPIVRFYKN